MTKDRGYGEKVGTLTVPVSHHPGQVSPTHEINQLSGYNSHCPTAADTLH